MKICTICKLEKDESEFNKHKGFKFGLDCWCKKCKSISDFNYRNSIKGKYNLEKYRKTEKYKIIKKLSKIREKSIYPEKYKARYMLNDMIFWHKKITRPNICSICNKQNKFIHGHHKDYNKPLDVIWCCPQCHSNIHKKMEVLQWIK